MAGGLRRRFPAYNQTYRDNFIAAVRTNLTALSPTAKAVIHPSDQAARAIVPKNDLNCCAVYAPAVGLPWVAFNQNEWRQADLQFGVGGYNKVSLTTAQLHCEMRMLDFVGQATLAGNYVGISKLCCLPCGAVLALAGVNRRGCHGKGYETGWQYPQWLLNTPGALQAFLGAVAWPMYTDLSPESQRQCLSDLRISFKE